MEFIFIFALEIVPNNQLFVLKMEEVYIVFRDLRYSEEDHETDVVAVYDSLDGANEICDLLNSTNLSLHYKFFVESHVVF